MTIIDWNALADELSDDDWEAAFGESRYTECVRGAFSRIDCVEAVAAYGSVHGDGTDLCGVFKLNDGRFGSIEAWCDYSGWD